VLTKSRVTVAASVLAIAAAGGSVVAARELSAGPARAASVALPVPVGSLATARVPSGAASGAATAGRGGADGTGSGLSGQSGSGAASSGAASSGTASSGTASSGTGSSGPVTQLPSLPAADGQGDQGPLPAGAVPADGAVPGASAALHALAAARASITRLPHSPQLLAELGGTASGGTSGRTSGTAAGTASDATSDSTSDSTPAASEAEAASPAATSGTSAVPGIDVAAFQHPDTSAYPDGAPINWSQVAAAGYRFAAIKGTEGDYYVNPWGTSDVAKAKAAGLDVTAYHFAIPNVSGGAEQAQFAVEYSGYATGARMLPLMLDIEYDPYVSSDHTNECYGLTASKMTAWISAFVATAKALTGQYPVIYTTADWWNTCTGGSKAFTADPMWVAAYGFTSPPMPDGWSAYSFWQYTSSGTVPGVQPSGGIDLDSFNPQVVGLIDPGIQASREWARVALAVGSLGSLAGERLSWTGTGLPPGLQLSADGVVTGTVRGTSSPLLRPPFLVTLTARNSSGATATVAFSWTVGGSCPRYRASAICLGSP
jgi:GH25 family lysozyme M1 (1,4-beta-N-acetylmuramidase)